MSAIPAGAVKGSQIQGMHAIRVNLIGFAALFCGALASQSVAVVGNLYLGEVVLPLVVILLMLVKGDAGALRSRLFAMLVVAGALTLMGYVISDLVVGTQSSQYLRGWGRVFLTIVNCIMLMMLVYHGIQNLWWFLLGWSLGGIIGLAATGLPFTLWKLGYGDHAVVLLLCATVFTSRSVSLVALVLFGVFSFYMDYRSLGAASFLVVALVYASSMDKAKAAKNSKIYLRVILAGMLGVALIVTMMSLNESDYSDRRHDSTWGRYSGIVVSLVAVANSPVIGYGSWTENAELAKLLRQEVRKNIGQSYDQRYRPQSDIFRTHSQFFQAWIEGGILGAVFFILYGVLIIRAFNSALTSVVSRFRLIYLYFLIMGFWHLLFSPFGGSMRIAIAIVVAVITAIMLERQQGGGVGAIDASSEKSGKDVPGRILRRRSS